MNRKSCPKRISQTAIGSYRDSFNKIMFNFLSKSTSIVQTCHFYLKMWFQISAILVFYAEQLSVFTMIDLLPLLDNVLFIKPVEKSSLIFAKIMAHNKMSILWKYILLNYKHCLGLKEAKRSGVKILYMIVSILHENSHYRNGHFHGNSDNHILGEFVKTWLFTLVIIFMIFPLKMTCQCHDNLGLKMKILKFLGIQPSYFNVCADTTETT